VDGLQVDSNVLRRGEVFGGESMKEERINELLERLEEAAGELDGGNQLIGQNLLFGVCRDMLKALKELNKEVEELKKDGEERDYAGFYPRYSCHKEHCIAEFPTYWVINGPVVNADLPKEFFKDLEAVKRYIDHYGGVRDEVGRSKNHIWGF
jgi:hypothetical protein